MKHLLLGLASFMIVGSPALALDDVFEEKGSDWDSGYGRLFSSGALISWRVSDVISGRINWSFLIPGDDNIKADDGYRYWSVGEINCKEGTFKAHHVRDEKKVVGSPDVQFKRMSDLGGEFCLFYQQEFKDSPYYK